MNKVQIKSLPVSAKEIGNATNNDKILARVKHFVLYGWPNEQTLSPELIPYYRKKDELSVESNCLLWGLRVIIPYKYQDYVLKELHTSHPGMAKMKSLARMHVFWPDLDQQIEQVVSSCNACQAFQSAPPMAPVNTWKWPTQSWQRIHIDFAGPFLGYMYLVVVDAHSKWPEVILMKSTTTSKTISELRTIFARYGLPKELVSDNGPQFIAEEFKIFLRENGIKHIKSAVKHPASNGEAERFVKTFKQAMKKVKSDRGDIQVKLDRFLLSYRTTPHSFTKETPAKLFMKRELQTRLTVMKPDLGLTISQRQGSDQTPLTRKFLVGEKVLVLDFRRYTGKWAEGTVTRILGPVTYHVCVDDQIWKRHIDQMRGKPQADLETTVSQPTSVLDEDNSKRLVELDTTFERNELDKKKNGDIPQESAKSKVKNIPETELVEETKSPVKQSSESATELNSSPFVVSSPGKSCSPSKLTNVPVLRRSQRIRKQRVL